MRYTESVYLPLGDLDSVPIRDLADRGHDHVSFSDGVSPRGNAEAITKHPCLRRPSCYLWSPGGDLPIMSVLWILYRLYSLDPSSPDFLRRLHSLIRHDEEEQYLSSLQGSQLTRLVDFLDEVRIVL